MNRSFISVIAGGFGVEEGTVAVAGKNEDGKRVQSTSNEETADMLRNSKQIIIVPGYGMAVAQAQYIVHEIAENLLKRNVSVKFAIQIWFPEPQRDSLDAMFVEASGDEHFAHKYNELSDMWSIGIIAYILCTNKDPFLLLLDRSSEKKDMNEAIKHFERY